uniref:Vesicle associated membrane protein 1 n=1 Tax=Chrysemys picta bellii TaxID=8478 RepID=A0A8C3EZS5_CHRPI
MSPCLIRSDPAQHSAPRAPEGGALGGGPPGPPPNISSNLRLQQSQAQMEEVSQCLMSLVSYYFVLSYCLGLVRWTRIPFLLLCLPLYQCNMLFFFSFFFLQVVSIMSVNVEKVLDRDIRLTEMDGKAEALEAGASVFKTSAGKLKRKYWWKNCKMMIMLGVICAIVMVAIVRKYHIESEWRVREPPSPGKCHRLPFG